MSTRDALLQQLATLQPALCEIDDESYLHAGHTGSAGGGHYRLKIISVAFAGKSIIDRHRLVYRTVGTLMNSAVHALSITALTPEEAARG